MKKTLFSIFISVFVITVYGASYVCAISAGSELVRPEHLSNGCDSSLGSDQASSVTSKKPSCLNAAVWKVGVLLPLTGEYAEIGRRLKRGLKLALLAERIDHNAWQLEFCDTAENSPVEAVAKFKNCATDIVLGPIQSTLARSVVTETVASQLPLILLAPKPELASLDRGVFQHFLSAANEALEIVRMLRQRNENRVALLHPDNDFGNDFSHVFSRECQAQNIEIYKNLSYNSNAVDFGSTIMHLRQRRLKKSRSEAESEVPLYPFSALVIADFWSRLRLIVPQLAFYGVEQAQFYGTHGGSEFNHNNRDGVELEGTIFIDSCFNSPSPSPAVISYKKNYRETYHQEPSIYDAYAYDTVLILAQARALLVKGEASDLVEALLKLPTLQLVTGTTKVSPNGVFSKGLCPVTFKQDE
ncbi:penicillin-binding protein activator [bacterium]|nr:penicillin-binding protein activator [bacterium]